MAERGRILIGGATSPRAGLRARRQHGVPVLRAVPAHERARERRLRPAPSRHAEGEAATRRAGSCEAGRPRGLRASAALRALRRPAAARRGGARAGARAAGAAVRRAAVQPRRQAAPPRARGDPRAAAELGLTVAYVTHDQEEALAVSDRIIVMSNAAHRADRHAARALRGAARAASSPTSSARPCCRGSPQLASWKARGFSATLAEKGASA
jgi:hypothetical protein